MPIIIVERSEIPEYGRFPSEYRALVAEAISVLASSPDAIVEVTRKNGKRVNMQVVAANLTAGHIAFSRQGRVFISKGAKK